MVALFVILTIVVCISIDGIIQWRKANREALAKKHAENLVPVSVFKNLTAPADMFLDSGHTWVKVASSGRVDIGPDSFAERLIGRIDAIVLPEVGKEVKRGDMLFALRQDNRRAAFASPVDGVVTYVDEHLNWQPNVIHTNPYKDGCVCSIKPKNLAESLRLLRTAEEAKNWLKSEARKFQEFFAARPLEDMELGHVLQDGGELASGVLEYVDEKTWNQFNEIFLQPREWKENAD